MSELTIGILSTLCICSIGMILGKLCTVRNDKNVSSGYVSSHYVSHDPKYILITKEHYETLKTEQKYVAEHPQLPEYTD